MACTFCENEKVEYPYWCSQCGQEVPAGDPKWIWEITSVETGKSEQMTLQKCWEKFGKREFLEIAQGYIPHIIAVKL